MSNTSLLGSFGGQAGDALMFRNRVINGAMQVSQRYDNVAAHPITAGQIFYTMDRFFVFATGANVTGQRIAGTGANPYVYRVTGAASNTQCLLIQRIEALNSEDLVNKTVTLQFEASAAVITSLDYDIRVPSARDNFGTTASVTSGTVTVSATPTVFTVTCTLPANAANGLQINLGKTSGLVASQTFSISGVQLEAGPTATPFERRPYSVELGMCEHYYQVVELNGGPVNLYPTTGTGYFQTPYKTMRAIPSGAGGVVFDTSITNGGFIYWNAVSVACTYSTNAPTSRNSISAKIDRTSGVFGAGEVCGHTYIRLKLSTEL